MAKLPAFQFYPADWRKDPGVQALTFHQRGIWFEILCLMHESPQRGILLMPNGKIMGEDSLARIIGLDKQNLTTALSSILEHGVAGRDPETGALINRRMVRDEELRQTRSKCGKMGGNPTLLNQKDNHTSKQNPTTQLKQNPTPSSSSSASAEDKEREESKPSTAIPTIEQAIQYGKGESIPEETVRHWYEDRKSQGWKRGNGMPITNWQSELKTWGYRQGRDFTNLKSGKQKEQKPHDERYTW